MWSAPTRVRFPVGIEAGAAPGFSPKFDLQVLDVYAWSHNGSTTCPSSAEPMGTSSISRRTRGVCIVCIGLAYTLGCVLCACGGVCGCVGVCVQILQLYLSCPGSKKKSTCKPRPCLSGDAAQASSTCRGKRRHVAHALCLPGELPWIDFGLPAGCELVERHG